MATHRISYAYPTSPLSRKLGHYAKGCYVARIGAMFTPHATYAAALAHVAAMGTEPERWSIDHPENARFAPVVFAEPIKASRADWLAQLSPEETLEAGH